MCIQQPLSTYCVERTSIEYKIYTFDKMDVVDCQYNRIVKVLANDSLRIVNSGSNKRYGTNESQIAILKFLCTNCEFNDICND